jgi:hypothetical protein
VPVSLTDHLKIDEQEFALTGAFDPILDAGSKLFIDPYLLKSTSAPELKGAYEKIHDRFRNVSRLLGSSKRVGDGWWRQASNLFVFSAPANICIGSSAMSMAGIGVDDRLQTKALETAKEIVDAGIRGPEILELLGILEEGIEAEHIMGMTGQAIGRDLALYSQRIYEQFGVDVSTVSYEGGSYSLFINPFNGLPLLLVPVDILIEDSPVLSLAEGVDLMDTFEGGLREKVSAEVEKEWPGTKLPSKRQLREVFLSQQRLLRELADSLTQSEATVSEPTDDEGADEDEEKV